MRNLTLVNSLDIIQCCRRICNPEVVYNVNQLAMAHEAMAAMKDEAAGIRNVIGRAEEIKEDSKSSLNKAMFQLLSDKISAAILEVTCDQVVTGNVMKAVDAVLAQQKQ